MNKVDNKVWMLTHLRPEDHEEEDLKTIGIYSTLEKAEEARNHLLEQEGFKDYPNGFDIVFYVLDVTHWDGGFFRGDED